MPPAGQAEAVVALDPASVRALVDNVAEAKAAGWLQADLKRWFRARGIDAATYKSACDGAPVPQSLHGVFVQVSITGLPARPVSPNRDDIIRHLEWLSEPARGAFDDALLEIAFDGRERGPSHARLYGLDEIGAAADFAVAMNAEGRNVYVGAALRSPDADRTRRSTGEDFYVATAVPIDIDHDYDATRARMATVCDDGLVVTTGLTPERRSQHWTRLSEPCDDDLAFEHAFAALVAHTGADMKVKDKARIMRLGGTVSYPKDPKKRAAGYCTELTTVTVNSAARATDVDALQRLSAHEGPTERFDTSQRPEGSGVERDWTGRVINGRESAFRDMLLKHLRRFQEEHGADPSPDDLWAVAYAEFTDPAKVDNSDARWTCDAGQRELRSRLSNTLRRLRNGRLAPLGLYSIDTEVGREQAEASRAEWLASRPQQGAPTGAPPPAANGYPLISATPYAWIDAAKIRPRDILYGRHLFRGFLSATVSPGGLGKSSLVMVEALAMVTGRDLIGEAPKGQLKVWYWNGEDPMEELQRRVAAACLHYEIHANDLGERLFVDSGRSTEIVVVRENRDGVQIVEPLVEALVAEVRQRQIDVVVIDPFVACHAVSENDNTKIEAVVKQWMRVAEEGGCAVELVHHVRKPAGGTSQETTVDDARGAGALLAKVRSARVLNAMSLQEANEVGVDQKERLSFFRVDNGKANLMPRGGDARWRKMVGVPLGNRVDAQEDNVGVATEWRKPSAFEGVDAHHLDAVMNTISGGSWRFDTQCSNWVGHAIAGAIGLDTADPQHKARVKSMLTTWLKTGVLELVEMPDAKRMMKKFVVVGSGV
jgi:hypothetical protein